MSSWLTILTLTHLIGLALAVGAATVKLALLIKCRTNYDLVPVFAKVTKPITKFIVAGLILLTLSGIIWLILGYPIDSQLVFKLILVAAIWSMGPFIDNVIEPRFLKLAPESGQTVSREFVQILNKYLTLELIATGIFYVIIILWVLAIT